jgi:excisionase family DNA binding protein
MSTDSPTNFTTPWITVSEAANRARCGKKLIYREAKAGRLQAKKMGGRRELRLLPEWVDAWLMTTDSECSGHLDTARYDGVCRHAR